MKRKSVTLFFTILLLFSGYLYSQSYQGPAVGTVNSGVVVTTDDFLMKPIGNVDFTNHVIRNTEFFQDPIYLDGDNKFLDNYIFIEDKNVESKNITEIGTSFKLNDFKAFSMSEGTGIPPDPHLAVGPNHVIAVINSSFKIFDKNGNLLKSITANNFFRSLLPNPGAFDPQVIYDHYENRWFMIWDNVDDATLTAYFLIAYSDDSDPLGTWYLYALPSNSNGSTPTQDWGDYPQVGYDDQAIYITSRQFGFVSGYAGGKLRILNKSQLYSANTGPVSWTDLWDIRYTNGQTSDDLHPIISYDAGLNTGYIMMIPNGGNFYALYKITNPITNPILTGVNFIVPPFGTAPLANQLGGGTPLIDTGPDGSGLKNSPILRDNILYATHHIQNSNFSSYVSLKYFSINLNTNVVVDQVELGALGYFYFYPTIAVDQEHNIAITYTRSAHTEYAGSYYSTRLSIDPPGLSPSKVMAEGKGNYVVTYGVSRNRWGDYLGAALDPTNQTNIWLLSEYAATTNQFGVWLSEIRMKPLPGTFPSISESTLDFGQVEVGVTSDTIGVIISNYGEDALNITNLPDFVGDFHRISTHSIPLTLNTYDSLTIQFQFQPNSYGSKSEFYTISNNSTTFTGFNLTGFAYLMNPGIGLQLYSISGSVNGGQLLTIDKSTGTGTNIGPSSINNFLNLTMEPGTGQIYSLTSNTLSSQIYRINSTLGDAYFLTEINLPNLFSIAFDTSGQLYATNSTNNLYLLDLDNSTYNLVSTLNFSSVVIAFNPINNDLWGSVKSGFGEPKDRIARFDLNTGDTLFVGKTGFGTNTNDIVFSENGVLYGIKGLASVNNDLISIDLSTGVGTLIGSTGIKHLTGLGYSVAAPTGVHIQNVDVIPKEFSLEQNYPNPFNPVTTIKFNLPINSNVTLTIYNLLGEAIKEIVNNELAGGVHSFTWNAVDNYGKNVSSGIYFYELKASSISGDFNQIRKMILLK